MPQRKIQVIQPMIVFIALLLIALIQTTMDQYLPSLPAITKAFKTNNSSIQLTLSFFMLGMGLSHMFYGPLSDKIGRKLPLLFGVGLSILGSLCCFLSPSIFVLIIGRFVQGFGVGCCGSVGRSLVRDLYADKELSKIGSYIGIVNIFIIAASPVLGGYIQDHYDWRANFLCLIIFGTVAWLIILGILPETNQNLNPNATKIKVMRANYFILIRSRVFLGYTLCACFAGAGIAAYLTIAPFLFQETLGLTPLEFGQLSVFIAAASCLGGIINSQLVMYKGVPYMMFLGVLLMIFGGLIMFCVSILGVKDIPGIMIPMLLFTIGMTLTFINAYAGAFDPFPEISGTASALYMMMLDFSFSLTGSFIAAINGNGQWLLTFILLFSGSGSLVAWILATRGRAEVTPRMQG